jgi:hypothetical protein
MNAAAREMARLSWESRRAKARLRNELDRCLPALLTLTPETAAQVRAIVKARELADKLGIDIKG